MLYNMFFSFLFDSTFISLQGSKIIAVSLDYGCNLIMTIYLFARNIVDI